MPTGLSGHRSPWAGFYSGRGTVTFNGPRRSAFNYMIDQGRGGSTIISSPSRQALASQLAIGELVELGGTLRPGKFGPELDPTVFHERGSVPMPPAMDISAKLNQSARPDGLWTELDGIVHAVNADGTLLLMAPAGKFRIWLSNSGKDQLANFIDARVLAPVAICSSPSRKVPCSWFRLHSLLKRSMRLSPIRSPVPSRHIADLASDRTEASFGHRVRLLGTATYQFGRVLFVQDHTGAARVQLSHDTPATIGAALIISGFPDVTGLCFPHSPRQSRNTSHVIETAQPELIGPSEAMTLRRDSELVAMEGVLIDKKGRHQRRGTQYAIRPAYFCRPTFSRPRSNPQFRARQRAATHRRLQFRSADALATLVAPNAPAGARLHHDCLLRSSADVALLHGPPWWTWKRTVVLILTLFAVLCGAILWIRLLRLRLHRQQEARLAFSRQILDGQESERRRIAANLHDSLGQNLLVIQNQVCLAMQTGGEEAVLRKRLDEISGVASQAIEDVRQITLGLRPYHLDRLGLTQAIQAAVSLVAEHSSILFATHVDNVDGVFDSESEIHVYRIVQESVNNIIKHSGASEAAVVVKLNGESVALSIRDNGRGFNAGLNGAASGYGLNGISERVRILGGVLNIDSRPGHGAAITVQIPVLAHNHA